MSTATRAGPTCGASYTRRWCAGTGPQTASPPSPWRHSPGHASFLPPRGGPARTGEGARRPIQAPPPRPCRGCGARLRPPPDNPYSRPRPPPPLPRRAAPTGRTGPTTKTLSTGTADGPPYHGGAAAGLDAPAARRGGGACVCGPGGARPRAWLGPVFHRGWWGGATRAAATLAAARPHSALPRAPTNNPPLGKKGDDPRVWCVCGRDALTLTEAAGGQGVAAGGHKTGASGRCVACAHSRVPITPPTGPRLAGCHPPPSPPLIGSQAAGDGGPAPPLPSPGCLDLARRRPLAALSPPASSEADECRGRCPPHTAA